MGPTRDDGDANKIFSKIDGPQNIGILPCENERAEAVAIGKEIEHMVGGLGFYSIDFNKTETSAEEYSFSDAAVLFRTTRQSDIVAEVFHRAGIPFQIASKDHERVDKGVGVILSILKMLEQTGSYMDMERVIQHSESGLGPKTVKAWKKWAHENNYPLLEALENTRRFPVAGLKKERQLKVIQFIDTLNRLGLQTRDLGLQKKIKFLLDNAAIQKKVAVNDVSLEKLIEKSKQYQTIKALCQAMAIQTDTDLFEANTEKVTLMTMHASKGLEFPVVFISGCEEGYLPFKRAGDDSTNIEEERRLLYVAMTRAQQALYLSYAKMRTVFGRKATREPSRFIRDIEQNLKNYHHAKGGRARKKGHTQLELFTP
jgi:superfamily I DNA/RNA helicase